MTKKLLILLGFLVLFDLALVSFALAQGSGVQTPSMPNVTRNYPGATPCDTTLQACISASAKEVLPEPGRPATMMRSEG